MPHSPCIQIFIHISLYMYTIIWYYNDGIILYDNTYMWYTPLWTFFPYMQILVWTPHLLGFLSSFFVPLLDLQLSLTNVNCFFIRDAPTKSSLDRHYKPKCKDIFSMNLDSSFQLLLPLYHLLLLICLHLCLINPMLKLYH